MEAAIITFPQLAGAREPMTIPVSVAAELLGISRAAAYSAVASGRLPALRIGRRLVVPKVKLMELLNEAGSAKHSSPPASA
jgi:excisionase family DNA binding protein